MPRYQVSLYRTYRITIQADDPDSAGEYAAGYISEYDASSPEERKRLRFAIDEIDMIDNDALDVNEVDIAPVVS